MSHAAHLAAMKLAFASGTADLNRAMLERFASLRPELPLYVVAEFQPDTGVWIPFHVLRSVKANRAAIDAAIAGFRIETSAMVLCRGTAYAPMRRIALAMAHRSLIAYDEQLKIVRWSGLPGYTLRSAARAIRAQIEPGGRTRRWMHRLTHPSEAEIPVRARMAQLRGVLANRIRAKSREATLGGAQPLCEGVTAIIPSRDGRELLGCMLPQLLSERGLDETIVIDNGSSDGTCEWLRREYPNVQTIRVEAPLSFARAVNAGVVKAKFRHTLLLNNDMIVEPGLVAAFQSAFRQIPELFCATAQIFFPPGIRREETGKAVWRREGSLDFPVRCDNPVPGEDLTWVLYGSGGCSLFDTAKLRELGGVSEQYEPAYVEDMDIGYRAWKRGWPSVFCAGARVEHRHRATTSRFFTRRQIDFFIERNYLRFLVNAIGSPALFRQLWNEAIRRLQLLAASGNEGALDALRNIPNIGAQPSESRGAISETEILDLGRGDVACFPGFAGEGEKTILVASPYLPFPLSHGGAVRIFNLLRQAARRYGIVLMAFCDEFSPPPHPLLEICREVVLVRRHGSHYRRNSGRPDVVEEFDSGAFRACMKQTAERWKPAIAQLEFTQMAQYADACPGAETILVEHDITFDLQEQLLASNPGTASERWEREQQLEKWRRFETGAWSRVDCVVTMSDKDAGAVSGAKAVATLPNGVDCDRFQPSCREPEPRRLLFIGAFRHLPNLLALEFFLREVWPLLGKGYVLHVIAGPEPDYYREFHAAQVRVDLDQAGIECEAFVADVRDAYRRATLVLAPLTASAGTNIKVLEAMAMGRVVVSTPAGVNGLTVQPGHDVVVASSAVEMAAEIRALSEEPGRRARMEHNARETALRFDWTEVGARQEILYEKLSGRPL